MPDRTAHKDPHRTHRRQVGWQIIFPLVASVLIALGVGILAILTEEGASRPVARAADISAMLVILVVGVCGLVFFILTIVGIYLQMKVYRGVPLLSGKIMGFLGSVNRFVEQGCEAVSMPWIHLEKVKTSVSFALEKLKSAVQNRTAGGDHGN